MAEKKAHPAKPGETTKPGAMVPVLVLSCALNVALGLALVLVSIERTELGYGVRKLEGQLKTRALHTNDLEVERGRLVSPYVLERKAAALGMRAAKPGQIRRLETPESRKQ
ncbi:MAG: hypothetical protein DELT_02023 [Desulfovibrio sp.]